MPLNFDEPKPLAYGVVCNHETFPRAAFVTQDDARDWAARCEEDDCPNSYRVVRYVANQWVPCEGEDT